MYINNTNTYPNFLERRDIIKTFVSLLLIVILNISTYATAYAETSTTLPQTIDQNIIISDDNFSANIPALAELASYISKNYDLNISQLTLTPDQMNIVNYYKVHPLRIGLYEWDPYFVNENGTYSGMNYYMVTQLEKALGIKTQLILGSFSEIKQMLKDDKVDIVPGLFKSEVDNYGALATNPYYLDMPCIYSNDMKLQSMPIESLQNIRLGKRTENGYFDQGDIDYLGKNHIHINISNYNSDEDLIKALISGKCDYIIGSMSAIYLSSGLYRLKMLEPELGKLHYVGVSNKPENIGLVAIINQFLNDKTQENFHLYLDTYNLIRLKSGIFFTPEENDLLQKNKKLSVKSLTGLAYPDVFHDIESGKVSGKEVFAFDRICSVLNIRYVNSISDGSSINQTLSDLQNNKIDVVLGVPDSLERGGVTTPSKSITTSKFCIIGYKDNINSFADIFKQNIGIVEGQIKEKYLQTIFPTKAFKAYYSLSDAYAGLKNGSVDYIIVNKDYYDYLVFYNDDRNLKNCYSLDLDYNGVINFDATTDGNLYASIFSKSLEFVGQKEMESILNINAKYSYIDSLKAQAKKNVLIILLPILLISLIFSIYAYHNFRKKTDALTKIKLKCKDLLITTNSFFWTYNETERGINLSGAAIEFLGLENLRLVQRNNQFMIVLNDSLKNILLLQLILKTSKMVLSKLLMKILIHLTINFYFILVVILIMLQKLSFQLEKIMIVKIELFTG